MISIISIYHDLVFKTANRLRQGSKDAKGTHPHSICGVLYLFTSAQGSQCTDVHRVAI